MVNRSGSILLFILLALVSTGVASITVYPKPDQEPDSADYQVWVRSAAHPSAPLTPVPVYGSFQFDLGSGQKLRGRPVSPVSFCSVDANEPIEITVRLESGLADAGIDTSRVIVRPLALQLHPVVSSGELHLRVEKQPCQVTIEPGGQIRHPLHLFINPPEEHPPDSAAPDVLYFGPGYHEITGVKLLDGQTLYLAGGAVLELQPIPPDQRSGPTEQLYGLPAFRGPALVDARDRKRITIRGRGLLSCHKALEAGQRSDVVDLGGCQNLALEGVVLREPGHAGVHVVNGSDVLIDNLKVFCPYINGDGIIIGGTSRVLVRNCFTHNADDSLEVKIWREQHDVEFRDCIVWNDLGGSLGLMSESDADSSDIRFRNCTVIHCTDNQSASPVIGLKLDGRGSASRYLFENIVVEEVTGPRRPALKVFNNWVGWGLGPGNAESPYEMAAPLPSDTVRGSISQVTFKNIQILHAANPDVVLMAAGASAPIHGVSFDNVVINGRLLEAGDSRLKANTWVADVRVAPPHPSTGFGR